MNPRNLFTLCLLLLTAAGAAAQERAVRGRIANPDGEAVPYCTVSLRRAADSTILAGVISDSLGHYRLAPLAGEGCFLEFAHLAYETATRPLASQTGETVCDVVLTPSANRIDEVTVLARFVERKAGRYTVSMAGNPLARDRMLTDVLELLPGLRREVDRSFKINGREIKTIYIDDRPATVEELRALPAGSVKTIEVQRFASSDQDIAARGAVLRITLRPLADGGYRGTLMGWIDMRDNGFSDTGFQMPFTMRYGKFNLYNSFRYYYLDELHEYVKRADYDDTQLAIHSSELQRTDHHTFTDRLNMVYEVTPRHSIGLTGGFSYVYSAPDIVSASDHIIADAARPAATSRYNSHGKLDNHVWQVAAAYRWQRDDQGSRLKVDLDYADFTSDKRYRYVEQSDGGPEDLTVEERHPRNRIFLAEAGLTEVFSDRFTLRSGGEYYRRDIERRALTATDGEAAEESAFRYIGNGAAAYAEAELSLGRFEVVGGLRLQWDRVDHFTLGDTRWRRKEYWRLCPNLNATYTIDEERGTSLDLAYTRDDSYIPYTMLSPLKVRESEFRYTMGNPALTPSRGYDLDATLTLRDKWTATYTYSYGKDMIRDLTFIDPDDPQQSYTRPMNCATMRAHILSIAYAAPLTKWWRVNWEIYGTYSHYGYEGVSQKSWFGGIYLNNSIEFTDGFGMQFYFQALSVQKMIEWRHNAIYYLNASLYATLCKKRLRLNLECGPIVNKDNEVRTWNVDGSYRDFKRHHSRRHFTFTVTYSFNNYKSKRGILRTATLQQMDNEYK